MLTAQQNLTEHYSNAIAAIQHERCLGFLTCLRPCIEWLGQILIYDLLGEKQAGDLMAGRIRSLNGLEILPDHARSLYGSAYYTALPRLYACTGSYKKIPLEKRANCNPKTIVECACDSIMDAYKTCSQISEHAGNHTMNTQLQAYNYALLIPSFVDKLLNFGLITSPTEKFFRDLFDKNRVFPKSEETKDADNANATSPDARVFLQSD